MRKSGRNDLASVWPCLRFSLTFLRQVSWIEQDVFARE